MEDRGVEPLASCLTRQALSPTEPIHHDAVVVVRGGMEPPASAVSERRCRPTELPDNCTPCGTRTRSSALKGQETTHIRTGPDASQHTVLPHQDSNLNYPEPKSGGLPLPYEARVSWLLPARDSNPVSPNTAALQATAINRISRGKGSRRPERGSNLQSRINNPLVHRLTDRGEVKRRHELRDRRAAEPVALLRLEGLADLILPVSCGVRSPLSPLQD